jgi:hypothetical protein
VANIPVWLWGGIAVGLIARIVVAWLPVETSFALSVPDDAYYYFTIARNVAGGNGISFDGLSPTNGFHPLWLSIITPFWWIAGRSQTLPVHLSLTTGALFDLVTMAGIGYLALVLTKQIRIAGLVVLIDAWNPYNLAASVNGLETSVGAMLFVWSLAVYWRLRLLKRISWQQWLAIGALWSSLLLARTDYAVIMLPCGVDLLWRQRHQLKFCSVAVLGGLIWTPWLAWNLATFGSFTQVSSKAYPYYLHAVWEAEGHTIQEWLVRETQMAYGLLANLARLSGFDKGILLLALFSTGVLIWTWRTKGKLARDYTMGWDGLSGLLWPTIGATVLLSIHGLVRWMYIPWYFVPLSMLSVLWLSVLLRRIDLKHPRLSTLVAALLLVFQLGQNFSVLSEGGMWASQARVAKASMTRLVPICDQYDMIGISDSGYYGYYLPCRVVNLDGVVNNVAFEAIREGRFRLYLDEIGVQYVELNQIITSAVAIQEGMVPSRPPFSSQKQIRD